MKLDGTRRPDKEIREYQAENIRNIEADFDGRECGETRRRRVAVSTTAEQKTIVASAPVSGQKMQRRAGEKLK